MKRNKKITLLSRVALVAGLFSACAEPQGQVDLPEEPFPIGRADLEETRTVRELRPGLAHVHVERGNTEAGKKFALIFGTHRQEEAASVREGLKKLGLEVRWEEIQKDPADAPYHYLTAGEFDSPAEAQRMVDIAPVAAIYVGRIGKYKEEGDRARVLDIVILDPKKYRGKIRTAWSEGIWPASPLELAQKHNAVVATNGGWFEYLMDDVLAVPAGISIVDGMWHHEHGRQRQKGSIIEIVETKRQYSHKDKREGIVFIENTPDGGSRLWIGDEPPPRPELKWGNGQSIAIDGIDRMPKRNSDEIVALRPAIFWHSQISHGIPPDAGLSVTMVNEKSSGLRTFVLATGSKRAVLEEAKEGGMSLDLGIAGKPGLNALFSYNILIENGERSKLLDRNGITSRTAIGADAEGKIYLMTTPAGAAQYESIGANLSELQDIGVFLGLVNFANLDGGIPSSSMVIEGKALGHPDRQIPDEDRRVADAVLIIDDE